MSKIIAFILSMCAACAVFTVSAFAEIRIVVPGESPAFVSEVETQVSETETSVSETPEVEITEAETAETIETEPAEIVPDIAEPNAVNFWSAVKPYLSKLPLKPIIQCGAALIIILICLKALKARKGKRK